MSRAARAQLTILLASFASFASCALACGPSFEAIHAGDARFEHCYAIDEGATSSIDEKAHCWRDYREHYAFGQARDRLTYAARRESLLARSQALPTDEAMMEAAPGQVAVVPNAPAPTNAYVPPPQMLQPPPGNSSATSSGNSSGIASPLAAPSHDGGVASSAPVSAAPPFALEAPGAPCANRCGDAWRACEKGCGTGASTSSPAKNACERCDKSHRTCMAACFR